jgi:hypothetical protein
MQPDFKTLKLAEEQPDFGSLRPADDVLDGFANVTKPKTSLGQKVLNAGTAVTNFLGGKAVQETFGAEIAKIGKPQEQKDLITQPTLKETSGSALQLGANFIPGAGAGSSLATKVGVGALTGYAFDVGSSLQDKESVGKAFIPGAGTLVAGALPILGKITGISGASKNLKNASNKLEEFNLRLTPVDKQNLGKQGKDIITYLADKKIVGSPATRYSKVKNLYDDMEKTVQGVIKEHPSLYKKTDVLESIKDVPNLFADDPAGYDEAVNATNKIVKFIQEKSPDDIPATLLNTYKRSIFNRAYSKNNADVVNETYHAIGSAFKNKLDTTIPELQKLNKEYSNIITAKKILYKAQSRPQVGLVGKAVGTAASAAIGGALGGPVGAAAGTVVGPLAGQIFAGTATRSALGATARTLSEAISKLPTDTAGNVSKKALLNLVELISRGN